MAAEYNRADFSTDILLGRLEGRLVALDERVDRYEHSISARFVAVEAKLDGVSSSLSQGMGGVRVVHWIGGLAVAVAGFVANHFWRHG